ncbi:MULTISPECIES: efflux RND transporter permease subunit [unclassified Iodidimonas]|jgi:multidrug efflux pump|uniref:efflux RND transporter permease subunit n=1 Tax=unclassified Iodidimonas TaxID=2626145 RepID=UPI0024824287|nr:MULTISPECIES: efflux RND transporter permease subunit [unclassified Iodidimonas]
MKTIIAYAIDSKRLVMSILLLILIAGGYAYYAIPKEDNPDVQFPFFSVSITHDGISPEDAVRMIIKPMERQLQTIEGVKEMTSTGFEGGASLVLEFQPDVDADQALLDVREAVDMAKADLPDDSDEPVVAEYSAGKSPIITIVLYGDAPERTMVQLAEDLKDRLETIPSVLEAQLGGKREEVLEVIVDPAKIEIYDVSLNELLTVVQNNNRLIAAGAMDAGDARFAIKVPGLFHDARDVANLPVKTSRDGVVTLGDLGEARRTFKDATSLARFNGRPAITIEVIKRVGTNTVETAEAAKWMTQQSAALWPETVRYEYLGDTSVYVSDFLETLRNSVLSAVALVAIVVVAALGWRSALLVGVSIPGAFLFGILILYALGNSINTVVLFGLILAVGLLVDGAIVVSEYADRKLLEGASKRDAFRLAAQRMAWPITASTATTLMAFAPLLFWPGIIGDFMSYLPLTLIFTLIGSLLMALIFLPTLGATIGKPGEGNAELMEHLAGDKGEDPRKLGGFTGAYAQFLSRVMHHPGKILSLTLLALVGTWTLFITDNNGQILFPDGEPNSARLLVHARGNLSINEMSRIVSNVESKVLDVEGVENRYTRIGAGSGDADDIIGRITLLFMDWKERRPATEIEAEIRQRVADIPGVKIEFSEEQQGPVQGKAIQIEIASDHSSLLTAAVDKIRRHLDQMDGLVDQEDSRPTAGIEWRLDVDRSEAGRFGTDITSVGSFIQLVTNGALVGRYRPDGADDEVDIRVRFPGDERGILALDRLRIPTEFGSVPISNFVERSARPKTGDIERIDGENVLTLQSDVATGVQPARKVEELRQWIADQNFDPRLKISFAGQDEVERESGSFLINAFAVALFGMGLILLAQFNSFYHAGLILSSVILSTVGAVFGLWLLDRPFVIVMTGVGIIALAGIVVNNNIVLIDTYDRLVKSGMKPLDAIVRTGAQRLRPVLLTTITTVTGLLPMVFQVNVDFIKRNVEIGSPTSFIWVDLALAIVFGLSFATLLTLVVTPSMLAWRVLIREKRALRKKQKAAKAQADHRGDIKQAAE